MKVIAVIALRIMDSCNSVSVDEYENNHYAMTFACGLVVTSVFFRRLSEKQQTQAIEAHRTHHVEDHRLATGFGLYNYALYKTAYKRRRKVINSLIECGSGCLPAMQKELVTQREGDFYSSTLLDRSDILPEPLARIREADQIIEIKTTFNGQIFCSFCKNTNNFVKLCSHTKGLISGSQTNVRDSKIPNSSIGFRKLRLGDR